MRFRDYWVLAILVTAIMTGSSTPVAAADSTLAAQLKSLEDREEIRDLLLEYGRQLDKRDFAAYSKLFAQDGEWTGGLGSAKTPRGIQDMLEKVFAQLDMKYYEKSFHLMSGERIQLNGDTATAWSHWTWVVSGPDGKPTPRRAGHYDDTLVREDGRWKIKSRRTTTDIISPSDTPDSLKKK